MLPLYPCIIICIWSEAPLLWWVIDEIVIDWLVLTGDAGHQQRRACFVFWVFLWVDLCFDIWVTDIPSAQTNFSFWWSCSGVLLALVAGGSSWSDTQLLAVKFLCEIPALHCVPCLCIAIVTSKNEALLFLRSLLILFNWNDHIPVGIGTSAE